MRLQQHSLVELGQIIIGYSFYDIKTSNSKAGYSDWLFFVETNKLGKIRIVPTAPVGFYFIDKYDINNVLIMYSFLGGMKS